MPEQNQDQAALGNENNPDTYEPGDDDPDNQVQK